MGAIDEWFAWFSSAKGMGGMVWLVAADDVRVTAVREALAPYAWKSLCSEALCRRALAAMDRVDIHRPLPDVDERVAVLLALLEGRLWRSLTVQALSRQLVSAAER
ncbi:hypothetical protein [Streptomyces sp. NPDC058086]|uniref:hypothetical protein n=1 Tax=Streptomyces sp. NPDC058086 TaxID=3346334 RepID=UPI0036EED699